MRAVGRLLAYEHRAMYVGGAKHSSAFSNVRSLAASIYFQVVLLPLYEPKFENMKFTIEIKMTAEVEVKNITSASVIRHLVQPAKPKNVILEDIMDDRHFETAARNQRLLNQLRADRTLFLRYAKLVALFEAFSKMEGISETKKIGDKMEDIEMSEVDPKNRTTS